MSDDVMGKIIEALSPLLGKMDPEEEAAVKAQLRRFQERIGKATIVGEAGGGLVKFTTNGYGQPISVEIDDLIFKETDKKLISDLFCAAVTDNAKKCQENARSIENELRMELAQDLWAKHASSESGGAGHN